MKFYKKLKQSSRNWLLRQKKDPYYQKSKDDGRISRASYKIEEIEKKFNILKNKKNILDLGAAPGGWCKTVKSYSKNSNIVAVDILDMNPIEEIKIIKGDFNDHNIKLEIINTLNNKKPDLILSDMSHNIIGIKAIDHLKIMDLAESVFIFALENLNESGNLVIKIFKGSEEKKFLLKLKKYFEKVVFFKPQSSRIQSSEIYVVAINFNNKTQL